MFDRTEFFNRVRQPLFRGALSADQVEGIEAVLDYWQTQYAQGNPQHLAYILATDYHETATTMQPIPEYGGSVRATRMYGIEGDRPDKARLLGNVHPGDGARYTGGLVQLTGRNNFRKQAAKLDVPLEDEPDLILTMSVSVRVLVGGMLDGDFTGKSLYDYTDKHGDLDALNARRVVNGTDKAALIAGYYRVFRSAIEAAIATYDESPAPEPEPVADVVASDPVTPFEQHLPVQHQSLSPAVESAPWHSGWKTHMGMLVTGVLGIAAMLGYVPGISPEAGAGMLQDAFIASGFRSAVPSLIKLAINSYLVTKRG